MDPDLLALLFRVYSNVSTDIEAEVEAIFPVGTQPAANASANDALDTLVVDVRAKRSDDGLRRAHAVLITL